MKSIKPEELDKNVFHMIGREWLLVTAEKAGKVNTMTASWGGLGVMWGKNVAYIVLRPQRYTKEFVDREEYFTLAFFGEEQRKALTLCGSKSGRDMDKVKACGLTVRWGAGDAPFFDEAEWVLVCRKLYAQDMDPACVLGEGEILPFYTPGQGGWHRIYVGQVVEAYQK